MVAPNGNGQLPEPTLPVFRELLAEFAGRPSVQLDNPTWLSTWTANIRMVDKFRVGRAFLAGDSAHIHSPAGGLGMNTGIQDAYNLGWKLHAVLSGAAGDSLLDTYQEERLPIAQWLLDTSNERGQAFMQAQQAGRGIDAIATPELAQLQLGYRWSSLSWDNAEAERELCAGDRAPDAHCRDSTGNTVRLFDAFRGPHFTLLEFGGSGAVGDHGPTVKTVRILSSGSPAEGEWADVDKSAFTGYAITEDTSVLVRPDGYLGLITNAGNDSAVADYLRNLGR
jgi:hypothetical protein